jgi:hypothetical protein
MSYVQFTSQHHEQTQTTHTKTNATQWQGVMSPEGVWGFCASFCDSISMAIPTQQIEEVLDLVPKFKVLNVVFFFFFVRFQLLTFGIASFMTLYNWCYY